MTGIEVTLLVFSLGLVATIAMLHAKVQRIEGDNDRITREAEKLQKDRDELDHILTQVGSQTAEIGRMLELKTQTLDQVIQHAHKTRAEASQKLNNAEIQNRHLLAQIDEIKKSLGAEITKRDFEKLKKNGPFDMSSLVIRNCDTEALKQYAVYLYEYEYKIVGASLGAMEHYEKTSDRVREEIKERDPEWKLPSGLYQW